MATQELLAFKADTRKGTVELVGGRIFLGGVYAFDLEVDDEPASGYTLAFYLTHGQTTPLCVAACYSYIEPINEEIKNGELRFDSERLRDAFRSVSGANLESLRLTVYLCKGTLVVDDIETTPDISAKGEVKLWWTPVVAMLNGLPIDTKGEKGDPGDTYIPELYEDGGEVYVRWLGSDGTIVEDEVNIKGPQGPQGLTGPQGDKGVYYIPGMYESGDAVYVRWVTSDGDVVNGAFNIKGPQGKSAYQIAVENGYTGTEAQLGTDLRTVSTKQDKLIAGDNITIVGNTISATGVGGGGSVTVDSTLSNDSTNPVQNKVVKAALDGKLVNSGTADDPVLKGNFVEVRGSTAAGILAYSPGAEVGSGLAAYPAYIAVIKNQALAAAFTYDNFINGISGGVIANNGCCFTPVTNDNDDLAFKVDRGKTLYSANITAEGLTATLSVSDTDSEIADGEVCVIWLHITVASTITTAPQITVPTTIQFLDSGPSFAVGSECMLALMSTDGGATWKANVQWEVTA